MMLLTLFPELGNQKRFTYGKMIFIRQTFDRYVQVHRLVHFLPLRSDHRSTRSLGALKIQARYSLHLLHHHTIREHTSAQKQTV